MTQAEFDRLPTSAVLDRFDAGSRQTLGLFDLLLDGKPVFNCKTLELPWLNNANGISCIPEGFYEVVKRKSPAHGLCFHVKSIGKDQVEGREWILIHAGNYYTEIKGCILVGRLHTDINKDGLKDVSDSKATLKALLKVAPDKFIMQVMS